MAMRFPTRTDSIIPTHGVTSFAWGLQFHPARAMLKGYAMLMGYAMLKGYAFVPRERDKAWPHGDGMASRLVPRARAI